MRKIALDIDDVLAGFYPGMCEVFDKNEDYCDIWCTTQNKWIVDHFHLIEKNSMFWLQLSRVSNPTSINFEIECYITSSPESMLSVRKKWLMTNKFPDKPVYHSKDKVSLMKELDIDILVDDKISTIEDVNNSGLIGIQFKPSYMSQEYNDRSKIITHLSQVNNFI